MYISHIKPHNGIGVDTSHIVSSAAHHAKKLHVDAKHRPAGETVVSACIRGWKIRLGAVKTPSPWWSSGRCCSQRTPKCRPGLRWRRFGSGWSATGKPCWLWWPPHWRCHRTRWSCRSKKHHRASRQSSLPSVPLAPHGQRWWHLHTHVLVVCLRRDGQFLWIQLNIKTKAVPNHLKIKRHATLFLNCLPLASFFILKHFYIGGRTRIMPAFPNNLPESQ